ncbi:MAG: GtrA family protein, partial [Bradymonadaceae bacterium]
MTTRPVDDSSPDAPADSARWYRRENFVRLVQFGIVGAAGVVVNWAVFELGVWAFAALGERIAYGVGLFLGIVVSIFANFIFNDIWTWGDRAKRGGLSGWFD